MTDFLREIELAEKQADDIVDKAKQDAQAIVKEAEREAEAIIEASVAKANINRKAMVKNAQTDAFSRCNSEEQILVKQMEEIKSTAEKNMNKAVELIVKKAGSI